MASSAIIAFAADDCLHDAQLRLTVPAWLPCCTGIHSRIKGSRQCCRSTCTALTIGICPTTCHMRGCDPRLPSDRSMDFPARSSRTRSRPPDRRDQPRDERRRLRLHREHRPQRAGSDSRFGRCVAGDGAGGVQKHGSAGGAGASDSGRGGSSLPTRRRPLAGLVRPAARDASCWSGRSRFRAWSPQPEDRHRSVGDRRQCRAGGDLGGAGGRQDGRPGQQGEPGRRRAAGYPTGPPADQARDSAGRQRAQRRLSGPPGGPARGSPQGRADGQWRARSAPTPKSSWPR